MPQTLADVRQKIDSLDQEMIKLLAERQKLVETAGRLKTSQDTAAVAAPHRVAQIIRERRSRPQRQTYHQLLRKLYGGQ